MINKTPNRPSGISRQALRTWGMLFLVLGIAGQSIVQNGMLGVNISTTEQLLLAMDNSETMVIASIGVILQFVQSCAVPLFAFLLIEGFLHTSSLKKYMLRVAGVALLAELPFNLAMSGEILDLNSRNPVFGVLLCLIMLYLYRSFAEKKAVNIVIKLAVTLFAILWVEMLHITDGAALVVLVAVLWLLRGKRTMQIFVGCIAGFLCTVFSIFYLAAPMSFLAVHYYNGEPGEENRIVNYLAYPVLLLVIGLIAKLAF